MSRETHAFRVEITQAEVQALRDKCEELADDVRALVAVGFVKGGA